MADKRGERARWVAAILTLLLPVLTGCPGPSRVTSDDLLSVMIPDRVGRELADALTAGEGPDCARLGLTTRDDTGTQGAWLDSVASYTVGILRTRGVSAYLGTDLVGLDRTAVLASRPASGGVEVVLELPPGTIRRRWGVADREGTTPPEFLGRTWHPGPRVPIAITRLRASTGAMALAEVESAPEPPDAELLATLTALPPDTPLLAAADDRGTHYLYPTLDVGGLRVERLGHHAVPIPRPEPPSPVMTEPLVELVTFPETAGAYATIDRTGHLWYGHASTGPGTDDPPLPEGLWGPPVPGHGGGLVLLEGLVVTAGDATEGVRDHLTAVQIFHRTGVIERARVRLSGGLIGGVAAIDLDRDGRPDLVVAHARPGGARLVAFLSGGTS